MNLELPQFVDPVTTEVVQVNQLKPQTIEKCLQSMSSPVISQYLSQINFVKRIADKMEKAIKEHIKEKRTLTFDDGKAIFEDWKVSKVSMKRFSEKKLLEEGTEEEISTYNNIKEKYVEESEYIKFG